MTARLSRLFALGNISILISCCAVEAFYIKPFQTEPHLCILCNHHLWSPSDFLELWGRWLYLQVQVHWLCSERKTFPIIFILYTHLKRYQFHSFIESFHTVKVYMSYFLKKEWILETNNTATILIRKYCTHGKEYVVKLVKRSASLHTEPSICRFPSHNIHKHDDDTHFVLVL